VSAVVIPVLLLAVGIIYVLRLPSLQITEISFSGLETLEESALRRETLNFLGGKYAFVFPRSSYFFISTEAVASRIREEFPRIAVVAAARRFPDKMTISVAERKCWGILCKSLQSSSSPACAYIEPYGFGYESAPEATGALIRVVRGDQAEVVVGRQAVDPSVMERLRFFSEELPKAAGAEIIEYQLLSRLPSEIRAHTAEGFTVILKRDDDFANAFRVLGKVVDGEIGEKRNRLDYIDLRFGNKVFYKMK
jgi:hypothetical protein